MSILSPGGRLARVFGWQIEKNSGFVSLLHPPLGTRPDFAYLCADPTAQPSFVPCVDAVSLSARLSLLFEKSPTKTLAAEAMSHP